MYFAAQQKVAQDSPFSPQPSLLEDLLQKATNLGNQVQQRVELISPAFRQVTKLIRNPESVDTLRSINPEKLVAAIEHLKPKGKSTIERLIKTYQRPNLPAAEFDQMNKVLSIPEINDAVIGTGKEIVKDKAGDAVKIIENVVPPLSVLGPAGGAFAGIGRYITKNYPQLLNKVPANISKINTAPVMTGLSKLGPAMQLASRSLGAVGFAGSVGAEARDFINNYTPEVPVGTQFSNYIKEIERRNASGSGVSSAAFAISDSLGKPVGSTLAAGRAGLGLIGEVGKGLWNRGVTSTKEQTYLDKFRQRASTRPLPAPTIASPIFAEQPEMPLGKTGSEKPKTLFKLLQEKSKKQVVHNVATEPLSNDLVDIFTKTAKAMGCSRKETLHMLDSLSK